jgi:hypothetical protein
VTPEQTTELLKALNQHNWFLIGCGIVWLLGTILQFLVVTRIKAAIENKQHFSRVRYERELKVYEELWPKLCQLQVAAGSLRPKAEWELAKDETEESRSQIRCKRFDDAFWPLLNEIDNARPFYSDEIWNEIGKLMKLCWGEAVEYALVKDRDKNYWDNAHKNADAIGKQIDTICEAIRTRLSKFDNV